MKQPSSDSNEQRILERHLEKARQTVPVVSNTIAREVINRSPDNAEQGGPFYTIQLNGFGLYSKLAWVSVVLGMLIISGSILTPPLYELENPNQKWSVVPAGNTKSDLQSSILATETDPEAKVRITYNEDRSQLTELNMIPPLKVSEEILEKLGFEQVGNEVIFEANVIDYGYLKFSVSMESSKVTVANQHRKNTKEATFYPLYLSKMDGKQDVKFHFNQEDAAKMSADYFSSILDDLVPITVPNPLKPAEDMAIFWFKAQPSLFDLLVSDTQDSEPAMATPVTENETIELRILSNPFRDRLTVEYDLKQADRTQLDLISVGSTQKRELLSPQNQEAGSHKRDFQLSDLPKGIYLLVLTTNTQRIAKRIIKE